MGYEAPILVGLDESDAAAEALRWAAWQSSHTAAPIAPDLCADRAYIKMRLDRIALIGLPQGEADRVKRLCNVK